MYVQYLYSKNWHAGCEGVDWFMEWGRVASRYWDRGSERKGHTLLNSGVAWCRCSIPVRCGGFTLPRVPNPQPVNRNHRPSFEPAPEVTPNHRHRINLWGPGPTKKKQEKDSRATATTPPAPSASTLMAALLGLVCVR